VPQRVHDGKLVQARDRRQHIIKVQVLVHGIGWNQDHPHQNSHAEKQLGTPFQVQEVKVSIRVRTFKMLEVISILENLEEVEPTGRPLNDELVPSLFLLFLLNVDSLLIEDIPQVHGRLLGGQLQVEGTQLLHGIDFAYP